MKNFDLIQINNELKGKPSITAKLDYWKRVIEEFINKPLVKEFGEESIPEKELAFKELYEKHFAEKNHVTSLYIPESIYIEHFSNNDKDPDFTFWFLRFNAQNRFEIDKSRKYLTKKLDTSLAEKLIRPELKKLNDFEKNADDLLHEGKFEIFENYSNSQYAKEIEYFRIKADYYKKYTLPEALDIFSIPVKMYSEHIYLKKFLEDELVKLLDVIPQKQKESKIILETEENEPERKFSQAQIALLCVYKGIDLTDEVICEKILNENNWTSKQSLLDHYNFFSFTSNRKAEPDFPTAKKLKNKIKLFESVIDLLPDDFRPKAKDELDILKIIYENNYL